MKFVWTLFAVIICSSCITVKAPPLIDRSTVMESEASGQWPKFEENFLKKGQYSGPLPFPKEETSKRKRRVYSILNGDFYR